MAGMPSYAAFLRAINLGAKRKFPKDEIRRAVESCGFTTVETYINTGNVRFTTGLRSLVKITETLEAAFLATAGFEVPTIVLTLPELAGIAEDAAELAREHPATGMQYVSLLKVAPSLEVARLIEDADHGDDVAAVRGRGAHLLLAKRDAYHQSRLTNATVEKLLGVATNRNVTVISALAEKWCRETT